METADRIEQVLENVLERATGDGTPPRLAEALRYAIFPGGGRVRPRLVLEVARAGGDPNPRLSEAFASSLELVHCASLVHDDLPSFDDADTRRGKPALHRVFGEEIAVLVGDGLIILAFEELGRAGVEHPLEAARLVSLLATQSGVSRGIVAGQAWESENEIDIERYHRAKTASLFEAAAMGGAIASGGDSGAWARVGLLVGEAYQVADDIADAVGNTEAVGKPVGQDELLGRPSIVRQLGPMGALEKLDDLIAEAIRSVPPGRQSGRMVALLTKLASRLCPPELRTLCVRAERRRRDSMDSVVRNLEFMATEN